MWERACSRWGLKIAAFGSSYADRVHPRSQSRTHIRRAPHLPLAVSAFIELVMEKLRVEAFPAQGNIE